MGSLSWYISQRKVLILFGHGEDQMCLKLLFTSLLGLAVPSLRGKVSQGVSDVVQLCWSALGKRVRSFALKI